jgi:hypothetical protein
MRWGTIKIRSETSLGAKKRENSDADLFSVKFYQPFSQLHVTAI